MPKNTHTRTAADHNGSRLLLLQLLKPCKLWTPASGSAVAAAAEALSVAQSTEQQERHIQTITMHCSANQNVAHP
jgi:hypothetical protein